MIKRNPKKNRRIEKKLEDEEFEFAIFDLFLVFFLGIYFYPYFHSFFDFLLSGVYQIGYFFNGLILSLDSIIVHKQAKNYSRFHGIITDLSLINNPEINGILINKMRYNENCEYNIDQNVTMKVIYDTEMLKEDTVSNIEKILKLFDDVYTVTEIDNNLKDHTLSSTWYRIPNLSKFKYKIGIHRNKIRRMMEVKDIFVKVITKHGKIFVNFAYVKFDIVGNHKTKFSKEYYHKLNPMVIERNDQYIESLCLARKSKIKNVDFNKKFASSF